MGTVYRLPGRGGALWLGDCLEVIREIPDGSVAAVVTDPPYFIGLNHNGKSPDMSDLNIAAPFYRQLIPQLLRVLDPAGSIYWFTDWRGYPFYYQMISEFIGIDNLLVWDKKNGPGTFYTNEHELVIFATRNRKFCVKGARNIIRGISSFSSGAQNTDGPKLHPTQKPVQLISRLILDSTKEGDTVLDPFAGSSTTGVACIRTGRRYAGIEIQEKHYRTGVARLREAWKEAGDGERQETQEEAGGVQS